MTISSYLGYAVLILIGLLPMNTDNAKHFLSDNKAVDLEVFVYLEGAYDLDSGEMTALLNNKGYLPGQRPKTFFATSTNAGHPYDVYPWYYEGKEGRSKDNQPYPYTSDVVDWVLVSLRTETTVDSEIYRAPALVLKNGRVVIAPDAPVCRVDTTIGYYVVIDHRNHLSVMSDEPLQIRDGYLEYDFSMNSSYMDGQKLLNDGTYAMYAGDIEHFDSHAVIDEHDIQLWKDTNGKNSSYLSPDVDLSGDVSIGDQTYLFSNLGMQSTVPR